MELVLKNGDYAAVGGGFERAFRAEEVLQRALFKLTARRGGFPLLPELGSRLHTLKSLPRQQWQSAAYQYAAEALEDEDVSVESVRLTETDGLLSIAVMLGYEGVDLIAEVMAQ